MLPHHYQYKPNAGSLVIEKPDLITESEINRTFEEMGLRKIDSIAIAGLFGIA